MRYLLINLIENLVGDCFLIERKYLIREDEILQTTLLTIQD